MSSRMRAIAVGNGDHRLDAELLGIDPETDIAVLRIPARGPKHLLLEILAGLASVSMSLPSANRWSGRLEQRDHRSRWRHCRHGRAVPPRMVQQVVEQDSGVRRPGSELWPTGLRHSSRCGTPSQGDPVGS